MHPPTPRNRREAALRFQADQLLRDAAAWGFRVVIHLTIGPGDEVQQTVRFPRIVERSPDDNQPPASPSR